MRHTKRVWLISLFVLGSIGLIGVGGPSGPISRFKPDKIVGFKKVGSARLHLHVFEPRLSGETARPAIMFFFGGGWVGGRPAQFYPFCAYFASRGMVALSAEYRVKRSHGVTPYECVKDAKSAVRWLRKHARELKIDPQRIVAAGGSAGGHLAACCGVIEGGDEKSEDLRVSSKANALVLLNPVLVTAPIKKASSELSEKLKRFSRRFAGGDPRSISPYHHVSPDDPPTIIFHGKADRVVPFETVELFQKAMHKAGVRCEVVPYEGKGHGFFNFGRGEAFYDTLKHADRFLQSLKYLHGKDRVKEFRAKISPSGRGRKGRS